MSTPRNADRPTQRRRHTRLRLAATTAVAAVAATLTLTACGTDQVSAPALSPAAPSLAKGGSKKATKVARPAKGSAPTQSLTFVYDPTKKLNQPFGSANSVSLPAGAVCDPASSGYGPALWDAPCRALTKPITVTVTWGEDATGHTVVEFTPDVRFVPGAEVVLDVFDKIKPTYRETGTIFWCPTGSNTCFDESANDSSLQTVQHGTSFHFTRRLKHFSGYNVVFGFDDDGSSSEGQ